MRETLAIISDLHAGGTTAICPAAVQLPDGGTYRASKIQNWLRRQFGEYVDAVEKARGNGRLILISNGDIIDGDHHDTPQLVHRSPLLQLEMAYTLTEPLIKMADKTVIISGTESHVGRGHKHERHFANDIDAAFRHRLLLDVQGVTFDIAHHARLGSRLPWGMEPADRLAFMAMTNAVLQKRPAPHYVIRAHNHRWSDSEGRYQTRGIMTGAWQFPTDYVHALEPGALAHIGSLIISVENGAVVHLEKFNPLPVPERAERMSYD